MLKKLTEAFSLLPETESIALSGSRRSAINDESSDWDVYIYSSSRIMPETREKIFASIFPRFSVNCSPFEEGDECMDEDGRVYDKMEESMTSCTEVLNGQNGRLMMSTENIMPVSVTMSLS